eukprot:TRINITY_DN34253_c0_g1_i3.p2 TRINITY_DN34253_c0_g1~~TRINITY_DN34253_c0_g1_i3.p2  ORF type:complete len:116 (-),score=16.22 TRINITY_DN34253_c0_g1_i3:130-477(-)
MHFGEASNNLGLKFGDFKGIFHGVEEDYENGLGLRVEPSSGRISKGIFLGQVRKSDLRKLLTERGIKSIVVPEGILCEQGQLINIDGGRITVDGPYGEELMTVLQVFQQECFQQK